MSDTQAERSEKIFIAPNGKRWSSRETREFLAGGFNSIVYSPSGPAASLSMDFVRDLGELLFISVQSKVGDDSAIFEIDTLQALALDYTSSSPADLNKTCTNLRYLSIGWRPELHIPSAPLLHEVVVTRCEAETIGFLAEQPRLNKLEIESKRGHTISATEIPECPALKTIEFVRGNVVELAGQNFPKSTKGLTFHSVKNLDLDFVRNMEQLEWISLENSTVLTFGPLMERLDLDVATYRTSSVVKDEALLRELKGN